MSDFNFSTGFIQDQIEKHLRLAQLQGVSPLHIRTPHIEEIEDPVVADEREDQQEVMVDNSQTVGQGQNPWNQTFWMPQYAGIGFQFPIQTPYQFIQPQPAYVHTTGLFEHMLSATMIQMKKDSEATHQAIMNKIKEESNAWAEKIRQNSAALDEELKKNNSELVKKLGEEARSFFQKFSPTKVSSTQSPSVNPVIQNNRETNSPGTSQVAVQPRSFQPGHFQPYTTIAPKSLKREFVMIGQHQVAKGHNYNKYTRKFEYFTCLFCAEGTTDRRAIRNHVMAAHKDRLQ